VKKSFVNRAGVLVSALLVSATALSGDYDPETLTVAAASLLPAEMLQGTHYRIADDVRVSGYMNYYTVNSDFGPFTAAGNRNLKKLLHEIDAIAELKTMTSAGVGTDAVVGVVTDTGKSVGALVTNPVGTVQNVGAGVSRFFKRTAKTTKDVGKQVSQTGSGTGEDKDDKADTDTEADPSAEADSEQPGVSASVANAFLGIGKAHRKIAEQLGVDPYSANPVLQAELDRVAQISGTVGRVSKVFLPIPSIVSTAGSVSKMVWELSPTDLLIQNQETLEKLGYDKTLIEQFFSNKFYSPTEQTILVEAVKALDQVKNREILLQSACLMSSRIEGQFMVWSVIFAESYHEHVNPVREFVASRPGYAPVVITESGMGVIFAPLDQLLWTKDMETKLAEDAGLIDGHGGSQLDLWVEGEFSPLALERLAANGWVTTANAFEKLEEVSD